LVIGSNTIQEKINSDLSIKNHSKLKKTDIIIIITIHLSKKETIHSGLFYLFLWFPFLIFEILIKDIHTKCFSWFLSLKMFKIPLSMPNALSPECFFPLNNLLNHESTFYSPAIGEAVFLFLKIIKYFQKGLRS